MSDYHNSEDIKSHRRILPQKKCQNIYNDSESTYYEVRCGTWPLSPRTPSLPSAVPCSIFPGLLKCGLSGSQLYNYHVSYCW